MEPLVEVKDLHTEFHTEDGLVKAVDGVNLHIGRGETLGVVGESGCGKSVTALSIMRLIPWPPGRIAGGDILFEGRDVLKLPEDEMRKIRGNEISMIFQEPMTSLNPVFTVGEQIAEAVELHQRLKPQEAMDKAVEMLKLVGIPLAERRVKEYPHQLSGGMRQRVMIAMALSCTPKLLIADEPTTALDVTIQAQILELMKKLKQELGMAIMLITHDLGVVAEMAERVVVMYAGKVVEEAPVRELYKHPLHPYTQGLLRSIPRLNAPKERLHVIEGVVPSLMNLPPGCRFAGRCPHATDQCRREQPSLRVVNGNNGDGSRHAVSCWLNGGQGNPLKGGIINA
ncbi:MAG: ABC transporter ATP-binding protein [Bacillota bacterium]